MSRQSRESSKDKDTVSSEDAREVWRCVDCKKDFKDINSRILECERCEEHHCSKCIKLSDTEYDILNARDDIYIGIAINVNKRYSKVFILIKRSNRNWIPFQQGH